MQRYRLRNAQTDDLKAIFGLSHLLNSINLPDREEAVSELIQTSIQSFSGARPNPFARTYLFVLEDLENGTVVGTSQIVAQHGTKDAPHIFGELYEEERYSQTIDRLFKHRVLRLGYNYDGPTEIGGLILNPDYRTSSEKPGRQLSFSRFLFMAMVPDLFRKTVLAELMPPLTEDGRSLLWDALGRKFTGLEYHEADFISRRNKEFIKSLFPKGPFYLSLFSEEVQAAVGQPGEATKAAQKLLESIGFSYSHRVDPFDGGPFYEADLAEVKIIKEAAKVSLKEAPSNKNSKTALVAVLKDGFTSDSQFCAVQCDAQQLSEKELAIPPTALRALDAQEGEEATVYFY